MTPFIACCCLGVILSVVAILLGGGLVPFLIAAYCVFHGGICLARRFDGEIGQSVGGDDLR